MITCLGDLEWCPDSSGESADISLVWHCYHLQPPGGHVNLFGPPQHPHGGIIKGGPDVVPPSALGRGTSPSRKFSNWGSREGGCPRSPASGWDQSDGSTLSASSGQDGGGESLDGAWGSSFTSVSSSELDSSKVTFLLDWVGLGDGTHLFTASPGWPTTEGVCPCWLTGQHLLGSLYTFYFLSAGNCPTSLGCWTTHKWWTGPISLCGPPKGQLLPAPNGWHPLLPLRPLLANPVTCSESGLSGQRLPASGHEIQPGQAFYRF